jgi:hypothetical protein
MPFQRVIDGKFYSRVGAARGSSSRSHRLRAEKALGKPLPAGAEVHHVDGDKSNPDARLVICQDAAYHKLLHARERIVRAGGNPDTDRICSMCHGVKNTSEYNVRRANKRGHDTSCRECRKRKRKAEYSASDRRIRTMRESCIAVA